MSQKVLEPSAVGVRKLVVNPIETDNVSHCRVRSGVPPETRAGLASIMCSEANVAWVPSRPFGCYFGKVGIGDLKPTGSLRPYRRRSHPIEYLSIHRNLPTSVHVTF